MTVAASDRAEALPRATARTGNVPERRCLVTGEVHPRDRLMRFVVGPDDTVVPDLDGRLPGRGLWLLGRRDIVAAACEKRVFARCARRNVTPMTGPGGESLAAFVEGQLEERAVNALALARKSGDFLSGFEKVRSALSGLISAPAGASGAVLLCAGDAGADGREKIARLAGHAEHIVRLDMFDAATLGRVAGRDHAVHALVLPGGPARQLRDAAQRLTAYRGDDALAGGETGFDVME